MKKESQEKRLYKNKYKKKINIRRIIALSMVFTMLFTMLGIETLMVFAEEDPNPIINKISIFRSYSNIENPDTYYIDIEGNHLEDIEILIRRPDGEIEELDDYIYRSRVYVQVKVDPDNIADAIRVSGIGWVEIGEDDMPAIGSFDPSSRRVKAGQTLSIGGESFANIGEANQITARYSRGNTITPITDEAGNIDINNNEINISNISGSGFQTIRFKKDLEGQVLGGQEFDVEITHLYANIFQIYDDLSVSDDITIFPNQGVAGSRFTLEGESLLNTNNMSVFFLRDLEAEHFTGENKARNINFIEGDDGAKDRFIAEVPEDISVGEYYIVLTNHVADGEDAQEVVSREKVIEDKFLVIQDTNLGRITSVDPNKGPDSGVNNVTIEGRYIGSISPNIFSPAEGVEATKTFGARSLQLTYGDGTTAIGEYNQIGGDDLEVVKLERTLRAVIGNEITFRPETSTNPHGQDRIRVNIPTYDLVEEDTPVDITFMIETEITYRESGVENTLTLTEEIIREDGFTFQPSSYVPEIDVIIPERIEVEEGDGFYHLKEEEMLVAIYGENFMVTRFEHDGQTFTRYPAILLGNEIILNRNEEDYDDENVPPASDEDRIKNASNTDLDMRIYNDDNQLVDGTEGNELGSKMVIRIPRDHEADLYRISPGRVGILQDVRMYNPIKDSSEYGNSITGAGKVRFVEVEQGLRPRINNVNPDVVTTEGGEEIVIRGSNFRENVRVFLDGEEITNFDRSGAGDTITFMAPPGNPGETQLQVLNPEGGIATAPFRYVETYTDPVLLDFSPKEGSTDTLVVVKGENLLKPDPTGTSTRDEEMKLIGTRVRLQGEDINNYNLDANRNINFIGYEALVDNKLLQRENDRGNRVTLSDYYHSVVLKDENTGNFYTITYDNQRNIILSDGLSNAYIIESVHTEVNSRFITEDGQELLLRSEGGQDFIDINGKTLGVYTPYRVDVNTGEITGNKVRVNHQGELMFRVPILPGDGYYDVEIVNPDTNRDGRYGNDGFRYYSQPNTNPRIEEIIPNEGSVEGGYTIRITGSDFLETATMKAGVHINGVEVPGGDIDISPAGDEITLRVPSYEGNLREDFGVNRLSVPVVVVNPDGASDGIEDGFTYVVPTSNPEISSIRPGNGNASGGELVEIRGNDFRFYEPFDDENRDGIWNVEEEFNDLNKNGRWDDFRHFTMNDVENYLLYLHYKEDIEGDIDSITPSYQWLGKDKTSILETVDEALKDLSQEALDEIIEKGFDETIRPVMPRVTFGGRQAKIMGFGRGFIEVETPQHPEGNAPVLVVNNDAGMSPAHNFVYTSSDPTIEEIIPPRGSRLGGDRIDILGRDFDRSTRRIYTGNTIENNSLVSEYTEDNNPLVRFTAIGNRELPFEHDNSGRLTGTNRATVVLAGELTLRYDGSNRTVEVEIKDGDDFYKTTIEGYQGGLKYIPTSILKDEEDNPYIEENPDEALSLRGDELISIEVDDNRFLVERGYARDTEYVNNRQIRVNTPAYFTVGNVPVFIINPDGGKSEGSFEYLFPDSRPRIIEILRDGQEPQVREEEGETIKILRVIYSGGNMIHIYGEDFRENTEVRIASIANIPSEDIEQDRVENPFNTGPEILDRLTFEMPNVGEETVGERHRVVVSNRDGGSAYSDGLVPPIYIEFFRGESNPSVENIEPMEGPASGGTRVRIEGDDFREAMEGFEDGALNVHFGEVSIDEDDINYIDYRTLEVVAPSSERAGTVDIRVENPDGTLAIYRNAFTFISKPKIERTDPRGIFANDVEREVTIEGRMFQGGAMVVIGGSLVRSDDVTADMEVQGEGIYDVDESGNNIEYSVVGGRQLPNVIVEDQYKMTLRFLEDTELDNHDLIIINPDGGISDPYNDFDYEIPIPTKPLVLEAIPGFEGTVQLIWSDSDPGVLNAADHYEIYGRRSGDSQYSLLSDTEAAQYLVRGLENGVRYDFMVRALNEYGSAIEFAEITVRTLSAREDDKAREKEEQLEREQQQLDQEGKEEVINGTLVKTLGRDQIPVGQGAYVVDFSPAQYSSHDRFVVAIPVEVLNTITRQVTITDGRGSFTFSPSAFYTREVIQIPRDEQKDATVRIIFEKVNGQAEQSLIGAIPRTQRRASDIYGIDFELQTGRNTTALHRMLTQGRFNLNFDAYRYPNANGNGIFMAQYDASQGQFTGLGNNNQVAVQYPGRYMLLSDR
ncbi:Fibronectin, type III domain protein [Alkaliphilus metalliredigens QYMF]|uniref:Fibronectin, type III domain protein n=1 Tax=Alkaliphilus metalliredigens (strain QYMF) TaxID=293826 RepID=A6TJP9_ALKMQ|nr:IPT/TIG domain-containing protein [Alkaliphilus metalliredigens]ABR46417.1 Fibronectin, type III domain protein [Alkaliphilus metalliredigens QYMF]